MSGADFDDGLLAGLKGAAMGAAIGGVFGGISKGIDAVKNGKANFWDGHIDIDLTNGAGAANIPAEIGAKLKKAYYVGMFEDARIYESKLLGDVKASGGLTLPELGIIVGKGVYNHRAYFPNLFQHEYGHMLQYQELKSVWGAVKGLQKYYAQIGLPSLTSATLHTMTNCIINHSNYWYETWANYLSSNYFGARYIVSPNYPVQNLDLYNFTKLFILP